MKKQIGLKESGFTIVEVIVAIAVGAILLTGLSNIVTTYVHVSQRGRNLNYSNAFVEAKFESLRNAGFNSLTPGTSSLTAQLPAKLPRSRTASMAITTPEAGLKQIDITVEYQEQGKTASHTYRSFVGELGVGQ